jgi:hypothetical protein
MLREVPTIQVGETLRVPAGYRFDGESEPLPEARVATVANTYEIDGAVCLHLDSGESLTLAAADRLEILDP